MPFFSVIIPTYNRLPYLLEALESVARQSFRDYEIIVVDDGSTDDTARVLERIAEEIEDRPSEVCQALHGPRRSKIGAEDGGRKAKIGKLKAETLTPVEYASHSTGREIAWPEIKVITQANAGPGAARNLGAKHASGEYLAFLDSDDVWMPWTLEIYRQAIEFGNGAAFVSGRGCPMGREVGFCGQPDFQKFGFMLEACNSALLPVAGTPSVAVKTKSFLSIGGFSQKRINGEDVDLWLRLGLEQGFVKIESPFVFQQRYHKNNVSLNIECAVDGVQFLFEQEANDRFPGGRKFLKARRRILAAMARTTSLECLRARETRKGWEIFRLAFAEQVRFRRYKYLLAFFPIVLLSKFRSLLFGHEHLRSEGRVAPGDRRLGKKKLKAKSGRRN
jgi:glycosyltransferase involved in cell wall biosynthesis